MIQNTLLCCQKSATNYAFKRDFTSCNNLIKTIGFSSLVIRRHSILAWPLSVTPGALCEDPFLAPGPHSGIIIIDLMNKFLICHYNTTTDMDMPDVIIAYQFEYLKKKLSYLNYFISSHMQSVANTRNKSLLYICNHTYTVLLQYV